MNVFRIMNMFFSSLEALGAEKMSVGGQAVIEGVLMKGPGKWALAVRNQENKIVTETWPESKWLKRGIWKLPLIRGFATMVDMMKVGTKALSKSANISLGEEEELSFLETAISMVVAVFAVVGIFVALPMFISEFVAHKFLLSHLGKNVIEGVVRGLIFIGYVFVIGLWQDMRRVFEYHGAEHKNINAYEAGSEMNPKYIINYSRIHKRCGTSFLLIVIFISIVVFSVITSTSILMKILTRVILLPLIIGISYEFIKYAASDDNWATVAMKPMLTLQYLTTREPDLDEIEVGMTALLTALDNSVSDEN